MNNIEKEILSSKEKKEVTNEDLLNFMKEGFDSINKSILQMNQSIVDLTNAFYKFFNIQKGKRGKIKNEITLTNINHHKYDLHNDFFNSPSRLSKTSNDERSKINI